MHEVRTQDDIDNLLKGLGIFGTAGGGPPEEFGRPIVAADFAGGRRYSLVDIGEVPDDALVVSGGYLGGGIRVNIQQLLAKWKHNFDFGRAILELGRYLGKKVDFLVPLELGGGNTVLTLTAGARLGIPVVDGDTVGRAVPEAPMTSMVLAQDAKLTPLVMIDPEDNIVTVGEGGPLFADELGRFLCTRARGMVAVAMAPVSGATLRKGLLPGTVSRAMDLGRYCNSLSGSPEEKCAAVAGFLGGWPLFWGKVKGLETDFTRGFYYEQVWLSGKGSYSEQTFRIVIKNETMAGWRNDRLVCMLPDLLLVLDPMTLDGVMNEGIAEGTEMVVAGVPCHAKVREALDTPAGRLAFSSERYYETMQYQPIEELVAQGA